mgnify:CR=1 FL=1
MGIKTITLTEDEWTDQFKPIPNDGIKEGLNNGYGFGAGPCLWETHGDDIKEVHRRKDDEKWEGRLWTIHDDYEISEGYHYVNRLGYVFTEGKADSSTEYNIIVEENE